MDHGRSDESIYRRSDLMCGHEHEPRHYCALWLRHGRISLALPAGVAVIKNTRRCPAGGRLYLFLYHFFVYNNIIILN